MIRTSITFRSARGEVPNSLPGKEKLAFLADVHTDGKHRTGHARTSTVSRVYQRHVVRWNCRAILGSSARALGTTQKCSLAPRANRSVVNCTPPIAKPHPFSVGAFSCLLARTRVCEGEPALEIRTYSLLRLAYRRRVLQHETRAVLLTVPFAYDRPDLQQTGLWIALPSRATRISVRILSKQMRPALLRRVFSYRLQLSHASIIPTFAPRVSSPIGQGLRTALNSMTMIPSANMTWL